MVASAPQRNAGKLLDSPFYTPLQVHNRVAFAPQTVISNSGRVSILTGINLPDNAPAA